MLYRLKHCSWGFGPRASATRKRYSVTPWFFVQTLYILLFCCDFAWVDFVHISRVTVYPKKYAHGFVVLCFVVVMQSFIMNSHEIFIHIHQGCFAGTGAIVKLPQCQWSKPDGYGKISQCITTTKHSKANTVCIFLGIYCTTLVLVHYGWWYYPDRKDFGIDVDQTLIWHESVRSMSNRRQFDGLCSRGRNRYNVAQDFLHTFHFVLLLLWLGAGRSCPCLLMLLLLALGHCGLLSLEKI